MSPAEKKDLRAALAAVERLQEEVDSVAADVQAVADSLQERYDDLSERAQASESGQRFQSEIESVAEAASELESAMATLEGVVAMLAEATGR